jgi:predicted dithiol-disulfide oxidoreductase (DUF899 family)
MSTRRSCRANCSGSDGRIHHCTCTELLFVPAEPEQNGRHVGLIWPLWNLLDFTPEGRGTDWYPKLSYDS